MKKEYFTKLWIGKYKIKLFFLVSLLISLSTVKSLAQESKNHWLPPLNFNDNITSGGSQFNANSLYFSTSSPVSGVVNVYVGTSTTPLYSFLIDNTSSIERSLTTGSGSQMNSKFPMAGLVRSNKGIRVESEVPVTVAYRLKSNIVQAATLVSKGSNAVGTTFRGGSHANRNNNLNSSTHYSSSISFMATQDGTIVTVSDLDAGTVVLGLNGGLSLPANYSQTFSLNANQTVTLTAVGDTNMNTFLGALIESNNNIAVNVGSYMASATYNGLNNQDVGIDQIVPVDKVGTEYVISRGQGSNLTEVAVVVAHYNNTAIFLNGDTVPVTTLSAGEYIILDGGSDDISTTYYTSNDNMYIRTATPAYVYQIIGGTTSPANVGMFFVPPILCAAPRVVTIPASNEVAGTTFSSAINIVTRALGELSINGTPLEDYLMAGTITNYGTADINGHNINGTNDFVSYKLEGTAITGDLFVESTADLYLANYGFDGAAAHGGYYSGFEAIIEIPFDVCIPQTLDGPEGYDEYQWYKNGLPVIGSVNDDLAISEGGVYYLEARYNGCDFIRSNIMEIENVIPPTSSIFEQRFCASDLPSISDIMLDPLSPSQIANGDTIIWYDALMGGNFLPVTTALSDATSYYAAVKDGLTGCESKRLEIQIVFDYIAMAPTAVSPQVFCASDNPTIADLSATPDSGTTLVWFANDYDGNLIVQDTPLSTSTALQQNTTYYAASFNNGTCDYENRTSVTVHFEGELSFNVPLGNQFVCDGVNATLSAEVFNSGGFGTLTYIWEYSTDNGASWTAVLPTDGTVTSINVTNSVSSSSEIELDAQFVLDNDAMAVSNGYTNALYRVSASTGLCNDIISTGSITLAGPIDIIMQPLDDQQACGGDIVTLEVDAESPDNNTLTYVWQQRNIGGTDADWVIVGSGKTLLVTATIALNSKEYRALIFSDYCNNTINRDENGLVAPTSGDQGLAGNSTLAVSNIVNILVDGPILLEEVVTNQLICVGNDVTFNVLVNTGMIGSTPLYLWEVDTDNDNTYEDITLEPTLTLLGGTNTTSQALQLINVPEIANGYRFRVSITTANCTSPVTSSGNLIVEGPVNNLMVTPNPADALICEGGLFTLSATADTPQRNVNYLWEESADGFTYNTIGTGTTLLLSNVSANKDGYYYRVIASTDACENNAISAPVQLRVTGPLFITTELINQTICSGDPASFTVEVNTGTFTQSPETDLEYVWEKRLPGSATFVPVMASETTDAIIDAASLNLNASAIITNGNSTLYRVNVNNSKCTSSVSSTALLTIEGPISFSLQPIDQVKCVGDVVVFEVDATSTNAGAIDFEWEQSINNGSSWTTIGAGVTLVLSNLQPFHNQYQYRAVATTNECARVVSNAAILTVQGALSIDTEVTDQTICSSTGTATFSVAASVPVSDISSTIAYQWYESTNGGVSYSELIGEIGSTLTLTGLDETDDGNLYKVALTTSACITPMESIGRLFVEGPLGITMHPADVTTCAGSTAIFNVVPNNGGSGVVSTLWEFSSDSGMTWAPVGTGTSLTITGVSVMDDGNLYRATVTSTACTGSDSVLSNPAVLTVGGGVVINDFMQDETVCADTTGAEFFIDASIGAGTASYTWTKEDAPGSGVFIPVTAAETTDGIISTNTLKLNPVATSGISDFNNRQYKVTISAGSACSGNAVESTATLFVEGPISVLTGNEPQAQTTCAGSTVSFTVVPEALVGSGSLSYEWQVNLPSDSPDLGWIPVSSGQSLVISNVSASQDGNLYRVVITSGGTCTPKVFPAGGALLTVEGPLTMIQDLQDMAVCDIDGTGEDVTFSVNADTGAGTSMFVWEFLDTNGIWQPVSVTTTVGGTNNGFTLNHNELFLTGITAANDDVLFRVNISSGACSNTLQSVGKLDVYGPLVITSPAQDQMVCSGGVAIFSTEATTGSGTLSYLWEEEQTTGSGTFIQVGNTPSYVKSNIIQNDHGKKFRVTVSSGSSCTPIVQEVTLAVDGPITITQELVNATFCDDGSGTLTHTFTVAATAGNGNPTYTWEVNSGSGFTAIPGETSATLTIPVSSIDNGSIYKVIVNAGNCSSVESSAVLSVDGPISIIDHPVSQTVCVGDVVAFSVNASIPTGGILNYLWEQSTVADNFNTIINPIGTGKNLILGNAAEYMHNNVYRVVISTDLCEITSNVATLTVDGEMLIIQELNDALVCDDGSGSLTHTFTIDATAGNSLPTYSWEVNSGAGFTSIPGETGASLTIPVNATDNGNIYKVIVGSDISSCNAVESTAMLVIEGPIVINTQPTDQVECAGGTAIFTVLADPLQGSGTLTYQWEEQLSGTTNWIPVGTGSTLVRYNLSSTQNGNKYRVIVGAGTACTPVISDEVALTVEGPITITADVEDVLACDGELASFSVTTDGASVGAITYQWEESTDGVVWTDVTGATSAILTMTSDAAINNGMFYRVKMQIGTCGTVISSSGKLSVEGPIVINTQPTDQVECAGGTAIFTASANPLQGSGTLTYQWEEQLLGTTNWIPAGRGPTLVRSNLSSSQNGNMYRVIVSAGTACTPVVSDEVLLTVEGPITITSDVEDVLVCDGDLASFSVSANTNGSGEIIYQWEESPDGVLWTDVAEANSAVLPLISGAANNGMFYRVKMKTGVCEAVVSSSGMLTVEGPIVINTQPADQVECAGETAIFTVLADPLQASGTLTYQWEVQLEGTTNWIPVGVGPILVQPNLSSSQNGNKYRVIVSAGTACTPIVSDEVTLTVEGPIEISQEVEDILTCAGSTVDFIVNATTEAGILSYQWEESVDGSLWIQIPGETTNTYSHTAESADDGNHYRVLISTGECSTVVSKGMLKVDGEISIYTQPASVSTCEGLSAIFTVEADGNGTNLTYAWEESKDNGATWQIVGNVYTYVKSGLTLNDHNNLYRVQVSTPGCTAVTSDIVTLTVQGIPFIDQDPEDVIAEVGSNITISGVISNLSSYGNYEFLWQVNEGTGSGWEDLTSKPIYSGISTQELQIIGAPYELNKNKYRLLISSPECNTNIQITDAAVLILDYNCDGDSILNFMDSDDDNDGIVDDTENSNIDVFGDHDNDNIRNFEDPDFCVLNAMGVCENLDADGDGTINQCDPDADGNGIDDRIEAGSSLANPVDTDGDGLDDYLDLDNDNNGILDIDEIGGDPAKPVDTDGNGIPDYNDFDNDGDGISDIYEIGGDPLSPFDTDGDGIQDYLDTDSDNDGLSDAYEAGDDAQPVDTDGDEFEDYRDTDSDDNGLSDTLESVDTSNPVDTDNNGIPDHLDFDNDNDSLTDIYELGLFIYDQTLNEFVPNPENTSAIPIGIDSDEDGIANYLDNDDDDDGILTINEDGNANNFLLDELFDDCDRDGIFDYLDIEPCDDLAIPNMFSPNGDGINDVFVIPFLYDYPDFSMEIFDRWGNKVYEYTDDGNIYTEPKWWNGTSSGRINISKGEIVPSGTYYYVIRFNKSAKNPKTGWVHLRK